MFSLILFSKKIFDLASYSWRDDINDSLEKFSVDFFSVIVLFKPVLVNVLLVFDYWLGEGEIISCNLLTF